VNWLFTGWFGFFAVESQLNFAIEVFAVTFAPAMMIAVADVKNISRWRSVMNRRCNNGGRVNKLVGRLWIDCLPLVGMVELT